MATTGLQLRSLVSEDHTLELSLVEITTPEPGPDEVVVRVEATPLNPSDLALLFGPADMATAAVGGTAERPVVTADIPETMMRLVAARVGESLPVGNEVVLADMEEEVILVGDIEVALFKDDVHSEDVAVEANRLLAMRT